MTFVEDQGHQRSRDLGPIELGMTPSKGSCVLGLASLEGGIVVKSSSADPLV